jgi:hypothetical protein
MGRLRTGENKRIANKAARAGRSTNKWLAQLHAFIDAAYEQGQAERETRLAPMRAIHCRKARKSGLD